MYKLRFLGECLVRTLVHTHLIQVAAIFFQNKIERAKPEGFRMDYPVAQRYSIWRLIWAAGDLVIIKVDAVKDGHTKKRKLPVNK